MLLCDIVFCVLTYKNHTDLKDFLSNLSQNKNSLDYRVVVVNNFADDESFLKIKQVANENECDFIENENTGYSDGNNKAVKYALSKYDFKYLIVCNPDTIVQDLDIDILKGYSDSIIAPQIRCINDKKQNPLYFRYMPFSEKLVYYGFKNRNKYLTLFGILLNKIDRIFGNVKMLIANKKSQHIYACHGSFIIFTKIALSRLVPVFDKEIFLFSEESDLAQKAKRVGISIIYDTRFNIYHKEDGSMNLSRSNLYEIHRKSYMYYYEKWNKIHKMRLEDDIE